MIMSFILLQFQYFIQDIQIINKVKGYHFRSLLHFLRS